MTPGATPGEQFEAAGRAAYAATDAAVSRSGEASRDFVSAIAGTIELEGFMSPDNISRIMTQAA